jgi:hypothetical protein
LRYKQLTVYIVLGITILLFASSITASPLSFLYAQQQQLTQNTTPTTSATSAIGVKIISPARGQQVPVGSLTISGTSKDNTNSDCTVYAIWDHLKPYQKVEPTGIGGIDDYSNWTFTYTAAYHLITNGTNQLTAKISCLASPSSATTTAVSSSSTNLTKWYSINVTGITSRVNQTKTPVPIATITTNNTNINSTNTTTSATASTPSTTPSLLPFPVSKVNLNNNNKNNNDDNGDQSGNPGNQDKKSSSSSDKQSSNDDKKHKSSNNKNNDDHDDSKTDNSSSQPHKKHDNSKSKTTTHHHDDHSKKKAKHIIEEKTKEVKHKIKHLKKQINKKISKHI